MKIKTATKTDMKKSRKVTLSDRRKIIIGIRTAWIYFCQDRRSSVLTENPEMSFGDVVKKLSQQWQVMSEEEKKPYEDLHRADKERHKLKKDNLDKDQVSVLRRYRRYKKAQRKLVPTTVCSAYMFFVKNCRKGVVDDNPDAKFEDIACLLGKKWNMMSVEERAPFQKLSDEDRVRYTREMDEYKNKQAAK